MLQEIRVAIFAKVLRLKGERHEMEREPLSGGSISRSSRSGRSFTATRIHLSEPFSPFFCLTATTRPPRNTAETKRPRNSSEALF